MNIGWQSVICVMFLFINLMIVFKIDEIHASFFFVASLPILVMYLVNWRKELFEKIGINLGLALGCGCVGLEVIGYLRI